MDGRKGSTQQHVKLMLPISYMNRATINKLRKLILHRRIKIAKLCSKLISSVPTESFLLSNTHIALHKRCKALNATL